MWQYFSKLANAQVKFIGLPAWKVAASAATGGVAMTTATAFASDDVVHPPSYPFKHKGLLSIYDKGSVRRGYQVYKEVCSACHSMEYLHFRNLVGVTHTEEDAKKLAADAEVVDGPNEEGEMFTRPGKLSDAFPKPYPNDEAARAANMGALPPDLSVIAKARHGAEDYLFALLTGYRDPPAGVELREGLHYNIYFPGGAIGMAQALFDDMVEYEDGTPATMTQHAKDVSTFLAWAGSPEHDERKLFAFRSFIFLSFTLASLIYWKRMTYSSLKNQRMSIRDQIYQ